MLQSQVANYNIKLSVYASIEYIHPICVSLQIRRSL